MDSNPEVKANLEYISNVEENGDTVDYVSIWISLAYTLFEHLNSQILLPDPPGLPLFICKKGDLTFKTNNHWTEVVYRSVRVLTIQYKKFQSWFQSLPNSGNSLPNSGNSMFFIGDLKADLARAIGCHRMVGCLLDQFLKGTVDVDLDYDLKQCEYDIKKSQIMLLFLEGLSIMNSNNNYKKAANCFEVVAHDASELKISKEDYIAPNFGETAMRCCYVAFGYHYLALQKYSAAERFFIIAVNEYNWLDPENMVQTTNKLKLSSILPHPVFDGNACMKDIVQLNEKDESILKVTNGLNPIEQLGCPFIVKQQPLPNSLSNN